MIQASCTLHWHKHVLAIHMVLVYHSWWNTRYVWYTPRYLMCYFTSWHSHMYMYILMVHIVCSQVAAFCIYLSDWLVIISLCGLMKALGFTDFRLTVAVKVQHWWYRLMRCLSHGTLYVIPLTTCFVLYTPRCHAHINPQETGKVHTGRLEYVASFFVTATWLGLDWNISTSMIETTWDLVSGIYMGLQLEIIRLMTCWQWLFGQYSLIRHLVLKT